MEVWTLNSSKGDCNINEDNFTNCTAIWLNICESEPQILQNIVSLYTYLLHGAESLRS
jgi:hypothetical protein